MDSKDVKKKKKSRLREKLQLLRSITNSHAHNESSIIVDASKYIQGLKLKVDQLMNEEDIAQTSHDHHHPQQLPMVVVETLEERGGGYLVSINSEKRCPGLLVSIVEAFEELGLNVLEARVSCTHTFCLQAHAQQQNEEHGGQVDCQVIEQAVVEAIKSWNESANMDRQNQ